MIAFFLSFLTLFLSRPQQVFLPLIQNGEQKPCGVEVWPGGDYALLDELGCKFVRYNPGTETRPGVYTWWLQNGRNWQSLAFIQADLLRIRQHGGEPVFVLYGNQDGSCAPLPPELYSDYLFFAKTLVDRLNLAYIEIWNEGDYVGGHPHLYGCWGEASLVDFVNYMHAGLEIQVGTSFGFTDSTPLYYLPDLEVDFVGFHYYGGEIEELRAKLNALQNGTSVPVWLTETNYLSAEPLYCRNANQAFEERQAHYLAETLTLDTLSFYYALTHYGSSWRCAALLRTEGLPNLGYEVIQDR